MLIEFLTNTLKKIFTQYNISPHELKISSTEPPHTGDFTFYLFPLLKKTKQNPEQLTETITKILYDNKIIEKHELIKGFLNIQLTNEFLLNFFQTKRENLFDLPQIGTGKTILVEFCSPNTNKPLHLGHLRNIFLGTSISNILQQLDYNVIRINLINNRGIHICKSMLAYQKWFGHETPDNTKMKGDHLVGKYYVAFETELKKQIKKLVAIGISEEEAMKNAPIMKEAYELLRKWESGDPQVLALWEKLNNWVISGFEQTLNRLKVNFDQIDLESELYKYGKQIILTAYQNGLLERDETGAIFINLENEGLDKKILLRADGTSMYITQDIGIAVYRYQKYCPDQMIYVVGNEQEYHFKVLKSTLKKLNYQWYSIITHYSYGMVELPEGKMKSREGTVVDADDLLDELKYLAKQTACDSGKLKNLDTNKAEEIYEQIGQGAIRYFILKVDSKKNILYDPKASLDFNGNTGPFIQYTYARIMSLLRKKGIELDYALTLKYEKIDLNDLEKKIILELLNYPNIILDAAKSLRPELIANYVYRLADKYNSFYQNIPVLSEADLNKQNMRLNISAYTAKVITQSLHLLGIETPEKM
ncbi:MAG: arginine--tRNA ligase [Bacteroidales bacterium]|nr:arginine--tRNA ligase [Bacteroidales bacterium]